MKNQFINSFYLLSALTLSLYATSFSQVSNDEVKKAIQFSSEMLLKSIEAIPEGKYPIRTKGLGEWELTEPSEWTSGFFPGCLWLINELNPDERFFNSAIKFTEGLEEQKYNRNSHDVGFMILNSFGNGYKLANKNKYKDIIIETANSLASRFNENVGCIQSWNGEYQVIIDNMMNLELLFWAAKNGGDKRFYDIAVIHGYTTIKNHLRNDGSSYHVVIYDTVTGDIIAKRTAQGFSDNSSWARGQAWGIYGYTMAYRETNDSTFLNTAVKMADYFINKLPADYIPYWDFNLPEDHPKKYKDASAAAIALSALLELRNYVNEPGYDFIINKILHSLITNYLTFDTESSGIILHSAYNVNSDNPFNWDASTIWGDYYFLESLIRYKEAFLH